MTPDMNTEEFVEEVRKLLREAYDDGFKHGFDYAQQEFLAIIETEQRARNNQKSN